MKAILANRTQLQIPRSSHGSNLLVKIIRMTRGAFRRGGHRSIQSISDDEPEPSMKSEANFGKRRSKRGVLRLGYRFEDVLKEQYGL